MKLDKLLKVVATGATLIGGAHKSDVAARVISPEKVAISNTLTAAGFSGVDALKDDIERLLQNAEDQLRKFRSERERGLDAHDLQKWENKLFESSRQFGEALRKYKIERGHEYPEFSTSETIRRFEAEALKGGLTDTRRQQMLEEYIREMREKGEMPQDTDATLRGQYCGEFPELCPPTN